MISSMNNGVAMNVVRLLVTTPLTPLPIRSTSRLLASNPSTDGVGVVVAGCSREKGTQ
jgi:hypothetical protein